jgi:hypothetical protein
MELNLNGKYHSVYKKYSKEIIAYFCNGIPPKEICKELRDEFGVKINYQAINVFYNNNKEYIDNCVNKKKNEDLDKIKEVLASEFCTNKLKEFLYLLTSDLSEIVEELEPPEKAKLIVSVSNSIAKFEGMDKSEININNGFDLEDLFDDDLIEDALNDFDSTD